MSVRVIYKDVAVGAEDDATSAVSEYQPFCDPAQLPHGAPPYAVATMEPNGWLLDGSRELLDDQKPAFWSGQLSGLDSGRFENPPTISMSLGRLYSSVGISLVFDNETDNFCSDITLRWYRNGELIEEREFFPDRADYFCYCVVEFYDRVDLQMNVTHVPCRYARLNHFIFGVVREFRRDELQSVKVMERIDLISTELSVNTLDATVNSKSDIAFMFQTYQPVYVYDNKILIGTFYIEDSTRHGVRLYSFSCNDAIGLLDAETIPAAMYNQKNAKELAEEIINGRFKLEFDPTLEDETVTGYIPDGTRRNALHHLAFALQAVVDTSGTDSIRIFRASHENPQKIPTDRTYLGGNVDTDATVTSVRVISHNYSKFGDGTNTVIVDGVTYYDNQEVVQIDNPDITPSVPPNIIEIENATLVNPSNVAGIAASVYEHYVKRKTHNVKIVMDRELPGDYISAPTLWGSRIAGNITSMSITLSGINAADCEVLGVEQ